MNILALPGLHLEQVEMEDDSLCVQVLASADDVLGLGPQQIRIYGEEQILALARFCLRTVKDAHLAREAPQDMPEGP